MVYSPWVVSQAMISYGWGSTFNPPGCSSGIPWMVADQSPQLSIFCQHKQITMVNHYNHQSSWYSPSVGGAIIRPTGEQQGVGQATGKSVSTDTKTAPEILSWSASRPLSFDQILANGKSTTTMTPLSEIRAFWGVRMARDHQRSNG